MIEKLKKQAAANKTELLIVAGIVVTVGVIYTVGFNAGMNNFPGKHINVQFLTNADGKQWLKINDHFYTKK